MSDTDVTRDAAIDGLIDAAFVTDDAPATGHPTPIRLLKTDDFSDWYEALPPGDQALVDRAQFRARPADVVWLDDADQVIVYAGWDGRDNLATLGRLPMRLPEGEYAAPANATALACIGWGLGAYQFTRYKDPRRAPARLALPTDVDGTYVADVVRAVGLGRDLINTPAADMAPSHLAAEVLALAERYGAACEIHAGDTLLDLNCGAIHAVGRAAHDEPCLIDLSWGDPDAPRVTLVGKGVTFDSGGLDLKPAAAMRTMKKDMGGGAVAVGLACLIMARKLPVRLRLLVPAAENAVSAGAFRPGDVLHTHKGLTVEIDNTDAEGRLLLCDALSIADADEPEVIFDFATLTGAARAAVGPEISAMFANDDKLAEGLYAASERVDDPVWRMPLHKGYRAMLDSKVADLVNSAASPYAGAITAALYLENFVTAGAWAHFDMMAFNVGTKPGRPEGGEAMALRAVFDYLEQRYGSA